MTLTADELAADVGVSGACIRKWVQRGKLDPVCRGSRPLMFTEMAVAEARWLAMSDADRARLDALSTQFLQAV